MITYNDIKTYVDEGKTSAEIQEIFAADTIHLRDTNTADVWRTLSKYGVILDGTTPQRSGSLVTKMAESDPTGTADATLNGVAKSGFNQLIGRPHSSDEIIRSNSDAGIGLAVSLLGGVIEGLVSSPFTPDSVKSDLEALTGGLRYKDVTVAVIDQLKTDEAARVAAKAVQDAADAALKVKEDALNEVQVALEAAAAEFRKADSTAASIKAAAVASLG
jgi:hypothetical protein